MKFRFTLACPHCDEKLEVDGDIQAMLYAQVVPELRPRWFGGEVLACLDGFTERLDSHLAEFHPDQA